MVDKFIDRALELEDVTTCMVCSTQCITALSKTHCIVDIPNWELLSSAGSCLDNTFGTWTVVDLPAVTWDPVQTLYGSVCHMCNISLKRKVLPTVSLANGYWIRPIPPPLAHLTIAEKMLIAHCAPGYLILYESRDALFNSFNDIPTPPPIFNMLPITLLQLRSLIKMPATSAKLPNALECIKVWCCMVECALSYLSKNHPYRFPQVESLLP